MVCLIVALLVATTTAYQVLSLPPPNSVDDYIRLDISGGTIPITEVTVAAWIQPTTLIGVRGCFFSYMSKTSDDDNLLALDVKEDRCSSFAIASNRQDGSSCSSYDIKDGKIRKKFRYNGLRANYYFIYIDICNDSLFRSMVSLRDDMDERNRGNQGLSEWRTGIRGDEDQERLGNRRRRTSDYWTGKFRYKD